MGLTVSEARTWEEREQVAFLLEAAKDFGSTLDVHRIYATLECLLAHAMPLDGLIVSRFDRETEHIYCEFVWSDGKELDTTDFAPVKWLPDGRGMQGRVIATGKAEIFDIGKKIKEPSTKYVEVGPAGDPAPVKKEESPAAKSAMMAPMILEDRVVGVVQAMSDQAVAYSDADLKVFEAVVLQMTLAWHNALTYQRAGHERRLMNRILETSPDVVYVFDLKSKQVLFHNGQLERLLGYSMTDMEAMDDAALMQRIHPEDLARFAVQTELYARAGDGDLIESEWRMAAKDGGWHWILNRARVFDRDSHGRPAHILGFATDITEKKAAEAQRRETEERYRVLTESGPWIVWSALPDGTVEYVNDQWRAFFGGDREPLGKRACKDEIHPDDRESALALIANVLSEGRNVEGEYRFRRYDGEYRWHFCKIIPMRNAEHRVLRWFGVLFDVHDQKETEAELARRVAERTCELEAAVRELEGFTYSVSHDLRGPLRAISGASMMLREDYGELLPSDALRHLERQSEAAHKMGTLIDDLLKLSRIGRQELRPTLFDLSALASEVAHEIGSDRIVVEPGLWAHGDPRLIRFVLLNLLQNAIKFSPHGGEVKVGKTDGTFYVKDQGIGFDLQYAEQVFRPFERLVRDAEYPGTGIGLANVHRIIQRHGGRVWPESAPGQGATFYFTLPAR